ncbi:hypothetical protein MKW94_017264 [Papaver nudicaule]|uniref:HIT-type domain-containing protein n=1 Tax=Papaver nudicaule TaxID=74823 RepID=A0AA41VYE0_PAPNU|nr:hypothetical protein [Papaver nudicaule]
MGSGAKHCEICKDAISKYKCPSCLVPYCSLVCYKKHKATPCLKSNQVTPQAETPASNQVTAQAETPASNQVTPHEKPCRTLLPEIPLEVEEPNLMLHQSQLESIRFSKEILDTLKDEKLHKLIYSIDSAKSENELENAMELEDFRQLREKILSVIGQPRQAG